MSDTQLLIDFEWWRDADGYRITDKRMPDGAKPIHYNYPGKGAQLPPPMRGQIGLVFHPLGLEVLPAPNGSNPQRIIRRVVRAGGRLEPWRPIDNISNLFAIFARDVKDAGSVLTFIQNYGPLTDEGLDLHKGELIDGVVVHAQVMRECLAYAVGNKDSTNSFVRGYGGQIPLVDVAISLVLDPVSRTPKLRTRPKSLLDGLWLQLAQKLSAGASIRQCQFCGGWFESGQRTGRRLDAKFCSDEHRIAFNSKKRTKEK